MRVDEPAVVFQRQRHGHRVDREVPPSQVTLDGVTEDNLGIAGYPVVAIGPVGGDLALDAALRRSDGAEGDTGVPYRVRPASQECRDRVRARVGGEIQVTAGGAGNQITAGGAGNQTAAQPAEQRVPHAAPHQV